jgi:uncharacterized membrane protein
MISFIVLMIPFVTMVIVISKKNVVSVSRPGLVISVIYVVHLLVFYQKYAYAKMASLFVK